MLLTAVSLLSLLLFTALVLVYATRSDIPYKNDLSYISDEVSLLVVKPFDLRYYNRLELNLDSDGLENAYVSLCQINCPQTAAEDDELVMTKDINFRCTRSIPDMTSRDYFYCDKDNNPQLPNLFVLKGSVIELQLEAVPTNGDRVPNIALNWFRNLLSVETSWMVLQWRQCHIIPLTCS